MAYQPKKYSHGLNHGRQINDFQGRKRGVSGEFAHHRMAGLDARIHELSGRRIIDMDTVFAGLEVIECHFQWKK